MEQLSDWLAEQARIGRLRSLRPFADRREGRLLETAADGGRWLLDFSSNDYLALSVHPALIKAAAEALVRFGSGAGAARLMSGNLFLHQQLEEEVARFKGKEAALCFGCGYLANTGIIAALLGRHDQIFSDRLNHASIHDGCRLSGAGLHRFRHNDLNQLEDLLKDKRGKGRALIVVESLYSMDGDRCPLPELVMIKERFDCLLLVDEAHATGVFGPNGGGLIEEEGLSDGVDLAMGTFGKALGSYGAFVAASRPLIDTLINRARSFIFSTALPPPVLAASLAALRLVGEEPKLRRELWQKVDFFKKLLREKGYPHDLGPSQIVPIPIGGDQQALAAAAQLKSQGLFVSAIRPPTVPAGSARLRLSITRHHGESELGQAARAIAALPQLQ